MRMREQQPQVVWLAVLVAQWTSGACRPVGSRCLSPSGLAPVRLTQSFTSSAMVARHAHVPAFNCSQLHCSKNEDTRISYNASAQLHTCCVSALVLFHYCTNVGAFVSGNIIFFNNNTHTIHKSSLRTILECAVQHYNTARRRPLWHNTNWSKSTRERVDQHKMLSTSAATKQCLCVYPFVASLDALSKI